MTLSEAPLSLDDLRRAAKRLHRSLIAGDVHATQRLRQFFPDRSPVDAKHADFLHIVARENGFPSWPRLKIAAETMGLDRAAKQQRLKVALYFGQSAVVERLLADTPDLAAGQFGLLCALYDRASVAAMLAEDPGRAVTLYGPRRPILHLAFSRHIQARPELEADMLAVAELLVTHGADVNDGYPHEPGSDHLLSALYGAIGHANNVVLGQWLLDRGANPNDNESLYHATELGHHDGLRMLLEAGADPTGTNALFRAMDFHDHTAVRLLLEHGAQPDDFNAGEVGGESPWVIPALQQAARRGSDAEMVALLLQAGARTDRLYQGVSAYAMARVFGHHAVAGALEAHGAATPLSREEALMARAADGLDSPGEYIDPETLPPAYANLLRDMVHLPDKLAHMKRLVALGLPYDRPDDHERITPTHIAGWEGLPEVLTWLLRLKPDLTHVNGYGGTLLSTILHGSENAPERADRDHIACLEITLTHGLALPRAEITGAGREDVRAFLEDWAERYPGQVV